MNPLPVQSDFDYLTNSREFGEFTRVLIELTGLGMALNSPDKIGGGNPFLQGRRTNQVCRIIRDSAEGQKRCQVCDRHHCLLAANLDKPLIYSCHAGFREMAVPIIVKGRHIATISSGQILPAPRSEKGFQALRKRLPWLDISESKLRKAYRSAPYQPKANLQSIMRLLELFARQLCESLEQIRELKEKQEKPEIRRAREYINRNFENPLLGLSEVAEYVGVSKAHFSHIFKAVAGVSFTVFVRSRRIEAAKFRLVHSEKTVTEICFQCGFNSMTHFNRVFRSSERVSPREYRKEARKTGI